MTSLIGQTLGAYHILEQIGQGGMATVYKAYDSAKNRYVAVKVLSPTMAQDGQFVHRFRREAEVLQRLDHPNIVPVEDFGQADGYVYLVMPYLRVGSLTDRLNQNPLSPEEGGHLLDQIARGLEYAHQQGVVHRDIKPSNILLDADGNAMLSDFGLVQVMDASLSLTGSALIGTPAYISPEQALGEEVDAQSDQYSLGILLFELTTGSKPFDAATPMATVMKHVHEPLPSPRKLSPSVPPTVEQVILKATAKDPAERFGSVAEMNAAFQAALAYVLDPTRTPPPAIAIPKTAILPHPGPGAPPEAGQSRRRTLMLATLLALLLLFVPLLSGLLPPGIDPAPGAESGLVMAALDDAQLTALSGTIEALSTQVVEQGGGTFSPEDIQTAAVQTVMATGFVPGAGGTATAALPATSTPIDGGGPGGVSPTPSGPTATGIPSLTPAPSPVPPSRTPPPTATLPASPSPTRTATPPPVAGTPSRTPTRTLLPSSTPPPPASPTPSPSPWPSPTRTVTASPPPPPTQTPLPPTPTPTEDDGTTDVCATVSVINLLVNSHDATWDVVNAGTATVQITGIHLDWPPENETLERIKFGGQTIWTGQDESPPTTITGGWSGGDRTLGSGQAKELRVIFEDDAALLGYWLELTLNGQCTLAVGF